MYLYLYFLKRHHPSDSFCAFFLYMRVYVVDSICSVFKIPYLSECWEVLEICMFTIPGVFMLKVSVTAGVETFLRSRGPEGYIVPVSILVTLEMKKQPGWTKRALWLKCI